MASKIYDVLSTVDRGRRDIIDKARASGFNVDDTATLSSLSSIFTKITPNYVPEQIQYGPWVRPDWLYDPKPILAAAEDIVDNGVTYVPLYIITLEDDDTEFLFNTCYLSNITAVSTTTTLIACKTSDGAWYSPTSETPIIQGSSKTAYNTHVWGDVDKKYVIIYGAAKYRTNAPVSFYDEAVNTIDKVGKNNITQIVFGSMYTYGMQCGYTSAKYEGITHHLRVIETTEATNSLSPYQKLSQAFSANLYVLEYMNFPGVKAIEMRSSFNIYSVLYEANFPDLEIIGFEGQNVPVGFLSGNSSMSNKNQSVIRILRIPKLKKIGTSVSSVTAFLRSFSIMSLDLSLVNTLNLNNDSTTTAPNALPNIRYLKLGVVKCYGGGANSAAVGKFEFNTLEHFDYEPGSDFGQIKLPRAQSLHLDKACTIHGVYLHSALECDLSMATVETRSNTLGLCRQCVHMRFPIIDHSMDVSGFPSIDYNSIQDLIEKLGTVSDATLTMHVLQYRQLTDLDKENITKKGWVINVAEEAS